VAGARSGAAIGSGDGEPNPEGEHSAVEAGAVTAEEEALASERAAGGATGPSAMLGAGQGGRGSQDEAHQRKIYLFGDPSVFTDRDAVAPQVIGETDADYEARIARDSGLHR
jgi:hypothetical protein